MAKQKVLIQPRFIRILHWLLAGSFVILTVTGLYIHNPIISAPYLNMTSAILLQQTVGFIAAGLVTLRLYYGFTTGDYKNLLFRLSDFKQFVGLMKFYLFIERQEPPHEKYNAGQKLIFTLWFFVFIFQFYSGMLLYFPGFTTQYTFLGLLQNLRFYHYLGALWFLATLPVHVYLVLTGDPGRLQAIFTGWARVSKPKKLRQ